MQTVKNLQVTMTSKKVLIPAIIVLVGLCIAAIIFVPRATIAIQVQSRALSLSADVSANASTANISASKATIPAYSVDDNESSSSSLTTTGSKVVGNNATGTVLVYSLNKSQSITIPKGTMMVTNDKNAYVYTVASDVTIPPSNPTPQSATVNLTAQNIGAQYNIGTNVSFSIQDQTLNGETTVTSNAAFQGGTSETAQVVAQADQDNLLHSLESQLYQKGQQEIATKITADMNQVKDSATNTDVSKSFDGNVGDKASLLNLSLTTKSSILVYKTSDLLTYAADALKPDLKAGEVLQDPKANVTSLSYDANSQTIHMHVNISGYAAPTVHASSVQSNIKHLSVPAALLYISHIDGVKHEQITVTPGWYRIFGLLPLRTSAISIQITRK